MTRLLVIRHAEPDEQASGLCYGRLDVGLSPTGRLQAEALARELGSSVDVVVSSPSRRALETGRRLRNEPFLDERLQELDFGDFEGRPYDDLRRGEPELFRRWMESPETVAFPGGESFADVQARACAAVDEVRELYDGAVVALVTHGGVARAILADALQLPPEHVFRLEIGYCRVSVVDSFDGATVVRQVNGSAADLPGVRLGQA